MNVLFILNDPPYGTERSYNALRQALAMAKEDPKPDISVFLMADAVTAAKDGQNTPDGYYNLGRMIKGATARGASSCAAPAWMPGGRRMRNWLRVPNAAPCPNWPN